MTDIHGLLTDEDAVSPVIAVILMVAVTVVLSAAVGAFVLDIGNSATETRPQAKFAFESNVSSGSPDSLNLTHEGGDVLETDDLRLLVDGTEAWNDGSAENGYTIVQSDWAGEVNAGSTLVLSDTASPSPNMERGDRVQLVWADGRQSSVLVEWTVK